MCCLSLIPISYQLSVALTESMQLIIVRCSMINLTAKFIALGIECAIVIERAALAEDEEGALAPPILKFIRSILEATTHTRMALVE